MGRRLWFYILNGKSSGFVSAKCLCKYIQRDNTNNNSNIKADSTNWINLHSSIYIYAKMQPSHNSLAILPDETAMKLNSNRITENNKLFSYK